MTILTQNSADMNAEHAFQELREAYPRRPGRAAPPGRGWGGVGLPDGIPPDWSLVEPRRSRSWSRSSARAACRTRRRRASRPPFAPIHEARGDYSLEFLGDMTALEARDLAHRHQGHRREDRFGRAAVLVRACR